SYPRELPTCTTSHHKRLGNCDGRNHFGAVVAVVLPEDCPTHQDCLGESGGQGAEEDLEAPRKKIGTTRRPAHSFNTCINTEDDRTITLTSLTTAIESSLGLLADDRSFARVVNKQRVAVLTQES
ncbi:hypothetical protein JG688_00014344, partial [Phytophthora aleatoria]